MTVNKNSELGGNFLCDYCIEYTVKFYFLPLYAKLIDDVYNINFKLSVKGAASVKKSQVKQMIPVYPDFVNYTCYFNHFHNCGSCEINRSARNNNNKKKHAMSSIIDNNNRSSASFSQV